MTQPLTVAYVVKGFLSRANDTCPGWKAVCEAEGELGLFQHLCDYADMVEEAWDKVQFENWSLVWDYEISEPLGEWVGEQLRDHDDLPDPNNVREFIAGLVKLGVQSPAPGTPSKYGSPEMQALIVNGLPGPTTVQVNPCTRDGDGVTRCETHEAQFFGVYIGRPGEYEWVADFHQATHALLFANAVCANCGHELEDNT